MTEPYYNMSYGRGFEGFINYANVIVDGWLVNAFLILIFSLSMYVLSKSEWKMSGILSFSFFICFITAMIFKLFTTVSEMAIFICAFGLAISVFWGLIDN